MPLPTHYAVGAASVANGDTTITFTGAALGTADAPNFQPGDLFFDPAQPLVPGQRLASVDYDAGIAELWTGWPGTSMTADPYEVRYIGDPIRSTAQTRRYLEMLGQLAALGIQPNAFGDFAGRDAYDDAAKGIIYLSLDGDAGATTTAWTLYTKLSSDDGDWSTGQTMEGAPGATGENVIWIVGSGAPSSGTGGDGDMYLRTSNGDVYGPKAAGAWGSPVANIIGPQGLPGHDGADGSDGVDGVSFIWRGAYSGATAYDENDVVENNGSAWIALQATTGNAPPTLPTTSNSYWQLFARRGTDGSGTVAGVVAGSGIDVDSTDPANPIVSVEANLQEWNGVNPSENGKSLVAAADYAAMRGLLDLEAGTDFYSKTAADAAFQPIDADLTAIAALATTSYGRGLLELVNQAALRTAIAAFTGDAGSGGSLGLVPAPSAGDAAALKFLKADGTWAAPGSGFADTDRRNQMLLMSNSAKALATYQRFLDALGLGFKASGDADASSTGGAVDTTAGAWKPSPIAGTSSASLALTNDANSAVNSTFRMVIPASGVSTSGSYVRVRLDGPTSGNSRPVGKVYLGHAASSGDAYDFDGTQVQLTFNGGSASVTPPVGGSVYSDWVAYSLDETKNLVVSIYAQSGGDMVRRAYPSISPWVPYQKGGDDAATTNASGYASDVLVPILAEVQVKSTAATTGNATLITPYQTADAARTKVRGLFEIDPVDAITLGTDWTVEYTCNGGTNWTAASTYTNCGKGQSGRTVVETEEVTCTSGTSFAARVKNLNNKNVHVYKAALKVAA